MLTEIFSSTYDIYFQFQGVILTPLRVKNHLILVGVK